MIVGNTKSVVCYFERSLTICKQIKDSVKTASNLANLGNIFMYDDELMKAKKYYGNAMVLNRKMNNQLILSYNGQH